MNHDEKTALIVVDVQNDFADARGSLYVAEGETVVPVVNRAVKGARAAGALVVYTQDWHPESTPHFEKDGGIWPVHCVMGTWGAEFHPDLLVEGEVVRKGASGHDGYSGFTERHPSTSEELPTPLVDMLRGRGIERVAIAGLATDYCVKETAIDSLDHGFDTTVLADGVRGVNLEAGDDERALDAVRAAGGSIE
ncbi:MAG: isochorismatase family protein [Actinobacteria bacterium]|jgi:nicotinamidase/pyrazinamidase|nr:isochorismatase family protein [Actinomycetota bacterium]